MLSRRKTQLGDPIQLRTAAENGMQYNQLLNPFIWHFSIVTLPASLATQPRKHVLFLSFKKMSPLGPGVEFQGPIGVFGSHCHSVTVKNPHPVSFPPGHTEGLYSSATPLTGRSRPICRSVYCQSFFKKKLRIGTLLEDRRREAENECLWISRASLSLTATGSGPALYRSVASKD